MEDNVVSIGIFLNTQSAFWKTAAKFLGKLISMDFQEVYILNSNAVCDVYFQKKAH